MSLISSVIPTSRQHECGFFQCRPDPTPTPRSCDPAPRQGPLRFKPTRKFPSPFRGLTSPLASVIGFGGARTGRLGHPVWWSPWSSDRGPLRELPVPRARFAHAGHSLPAVTSASSMQSSPARERPLSGSSMLLVHKVIEDGHPHGLKYHADATCSEPVAEIK